MNVLDVVIMSDAISAFFMYNKGLKKTIYFILDRNSKPKILRPNVDKMDRTQPVRIPRIYHYFNV